MCSVLWNGMSRVLLNYPKSKVKRNVEPSRDLRFRPSLRQDDASGVGRQTPSK